MINYSKHRPQISQLAKQFNDSFVEHIVLDGFLNDDAAEQILSEFPDLNEITLNKSRDYLFAKNKYEKSGISSMGCSLSALRNELLSTDFSLFLESITGEKVFIDPEFHGGGIHMGGEGSFLNLHADFNYHPLHNNWFRNLNILIYFNKNWEKSFGGELILKHKVTGEKVLVEPLFNRCVIMLTRDYTLHGYETISFPKGEYRCSIAAYAYSIDMEKNAAARSTVWYPDKSGKLKKFLGRNWPLLVKYKNRIFGSSTKKNK